MEWETPIDMYILVVGVFLPLIISIFKNLAWSDAAKKILFLVFAFVASLIHLYFMEGITWADWPITFLKIGVLMQSVYTWVWKPTGIDEKIAASVGFGSTKSNK